MSGWRWVVPGALLTGVCAAQDVTPVVHVANPPNLVAQQAKHYVVLVSLDGFRYDYGQKHRAPHLAEMAAAAASTPQTAEAVHHLDDMMGKLRAAVKQTGLPVDLIVTADHGMLRTDPKPVVLDEFARLDHFKTEGALLYADTMRRRPMKHSGRTPTRGLRVPEVGGSQRAALYGQRAGGRPGDRRKGAVQQYAHAPRRPPNAGSGRGASEALNAQS